MSGAWRRAFGRAEEAKQDDIDPTLPIYKLVRSLEDVQDKIVGGDLKAVEMQRFMIGMIDRRLRTAGPDDFNDLRNVDAAMIYAMSGAIRQRLIRLSPMMHAAISTRGSPMRF